MFPVTNIKVSRTPDGIRVCGTITAPPVQVAGQAIPIPPVPVCVEIDREQVAKVLGDVQAEGGRLWSKVKAWFR